MNRSGSKRKKGRPRSKYSPDFIDDIVEYFNVDDDLIYRERVASKQTGKFGTTEKIEYIGCDLPMFEGFAKKIGVTTVTIQNWEKKYPDFHEACNKCRDRQRLILVQNGLKGTYNPIFMKIASINLMNWTDGKKDITSTIKREAAKLPDKELSAEINKRISNTTPFKKRSKTA